ncbi:response regulator transcription factor [Paracidobacterium acidisoli]|uniref:DNA-binding response regulator n=1 Tax=Paracidobacterium acidisoli TaxID=2303751 RepID=A0A372IN62_9BACT|nr:response regulator transcription factor [Paracidobacterium acidisoli]MBT9332044.1 response regulator transcription factor [Paracidobacterium acidisoli]
MSVSTQIVQATAPHLLLVDDDVSLSRLIREYCETDGLDVTLAATGEEGIYLSQQKHFQLVVLDVMLPGINGFDVLKRIRQRSNMPVLMLTTRGATQDRIQGLQGGADDYLPKPFEPEELVARIHAILRRAYPTPTTAHFVVGDVTLDEKERSVQVGSAFPELTGAEFHLLRLLLENQGKPLTREELVPQVFGRDMGIFDRSIDNLVGNLRKKLGAYPSGSERIKGIRNVGYVYVTEKAGT